MNVASIGMGLHALRNRVWAESLPSDPGGAAAGSAGQNLEAKACRLLHKG
jgi:hypothetical protein